jgi:hypothetical protein
MNRNFDNWRTTGKLAEQELEKTGEDQESLALAVLIFSLVRFPWEHVTKTAGKKKPDFDYAELAQGIRDFYLEHGYQRCLSWSKWLQLKKLLSTHLSIEAQVQLGFHYPFEVTSSQKEAKRDVFEILLQEYLVNVFNALTLADDEMGWKKVGRFPENSIRLKKAVTQPYDITTSTRWRIAPLQNSFSSRDAEREHILTLEDLFEESEQSNRTILYELQERSLTVGDLYTMPEWHLTTQVFVTLYYHIHGRWPGLDPNWGAVKEALEAGRYVDFSHTKQHINLSTRLSKIDFLLKVLGEEYFFYKSNSTQTLQTRSQEQVDKQYFVE